VAWVLVVEVVLVMLALLWAGYEVARQADARTRQQWAQQQTQMADMWSRTINTRLESHQRLLALMAQGLHTSLLDKPEVMAALMQQDGSMLQLFDSLYVALKGGSISSYGLGPAQVALDDAARDAIRRSLEDGKPSLTHLAIKDDAQHLYVLVAVPLRRTTEKVPGVLAAVIKLTLAGLMPASSALGERAQYALLTGNGTVLAHSDGAQRWRNIQELLGAKATQWPALSEPSVPNADTRNWQDLLVTRVGLPLPQWQAVVLRDLGQELWLERGLPKERWIRLGAGGLALAILASWLLWSGLASGLSIHTPNPLLPGGAPVRKKRWGRRLHESPTPAVLPTEEIPNSPQAGALAMFEAVPSAMLLEQDGRVTMATPQVSIMLGWDVQPEDALLMEQLFDSAEELTSVRHTLVELGSYEGSVVLRKKDGGSAQVDVLAWAPSQLASATVWRLRLPWRQQRAVFMFHEDHAWRDPLTGLPSREAFMWSLQSWMNDSMGPPKRNPEGMVARIPAQACLLFADVDHLGMLNTLTSRDMGNKVLRHTGRLLASYTKSLGEVARLGGDEFAVLLPGVSVAHAQGIAQALCEAVWRWQPSWGGERHWVSISIGVVAVDALRHSPQDALRAADMACYEAKRRGRGQAAVGHIAAPHAAANG
jgi:diguanylate cyclase (GGDEF)-like protein